MLVVLYETPKDSITMILAVGKIEKKVNTCGRTVAWILRSREVGGSSL